MYEEIKKRVIEESNYMLQTNKTIREIAKDFNISKSTTHKDLSERLREVDIELFYQVSSIIENHKDTRHIKGGESTKKKYLKLKERRE